MALLDFILAERRHRKVLRVLGAHLLWFVAGTCALIGAGFVLFAHPVAPAPNLLAPKPSDAHLLPYIVPIPSAPRPYPNR